MGRLARLRSTVEDPEPVNQQLLCLFRWALREGRAQAAADWLAEVRRQAPSGDEELFFPVEVAVKMALTGNQKLLDPLAPEAPDVVENLFGRTSG